MQDFEHLVDRIYEAAAFPDEWPSVMDDLAKSAGGSWAGLLTRRSDSWLGWRFSSSAEESADKWLRSEAAQRSTATARLFAAQRAGFVADHEIFSEQEYLADTFMTEWCTPTGFHHGAATGIQMPNGDVAVVQVMHRTGLPALTPAVLTGLDRYRPHLARAAMLAARWRLERVRAATAALALVGLPAAVIDSRGRVLAANGLIEDLTGHVVWLPHNEIAFFDKEASVFFKRAIAGLTASSTTGGRSFPVRHAEQSEPVVAHVVPTGGRGRDLFEGGLAVLVVTALSSRQADLTLIQGLFDLTPAEARVASGVTQGLSLEMIAESHGTSRETVRSQLKAVLAKTGTHRQTELAVKLGGLPLLHG